MKHQTMKCKRSILFWLTFGLVITSLTPSMLQAMPQSAGKKAVASKTRPKTFSTPQQAADALIQAAEQYDVAALETILGSDGHDIIVTGEPVRDKEIATQFAAHARTKMDVALDPKNKRRAILSVGEESWPLPIPIVKVGRTWSFDSRAGRQELLYRRVGRNELDAIEVCRGFVVAQHDYAFEKRDGSGVNQYAQRIVSTPGTQDGLAWQNADGTWGGPVGEEIARVIAAGYSSRTEPYHGYHFKVLKGQGPAAPLGQMDFVVNGVMIGGFALVAVPAEYRVTGVKTFMVSHDGVVYQKDLGPNSLEIAKKLERFNPDRTWAPVNE